MLSRLLVAANFRKFATGCSMGLIDALNRKNANWQLGVTFGLFFFRNLDPKYLVGKLATKMVWVFFVLCEALWIEDYPKV